VAPGKRSARDKQVFNARDTEDAKEDQKRGRAQNKFAPTEIDRDLEMIPITEPAGTPKLSLEQAGCFATLLRVTSGLSILWKAA
jgi:hypothetical protein